MRAMMQRFRHAVRRLYRDEQGAEGLEKLLILALVVLPLLAVLIFFAGDIKEWMTGKWEDVKDEADTLEHN